MSPLFDEDPDGSAFRIFAAGMLIWFVVMIVCGLVFNLIDRIRSRR